MYLYRIKSNVEVSRNNPYIELFFPSPTIPSFLIALFFFRYFPYFLISLF